MRVSIFSKVCLWIIYISPPINCISIRGCTTNDSKFNDLTHTLIISWFLWSEAGHGLAESSPSRSLSGLRCHLKVYVRKDPLPSSYGWWWNSVPWGLLDWVLNSLLAVGQTPLLVPCHVGLSSVAVLLIKVCKLRGNRESASKTEVSILCNLIAKVTSHQHCCIVLVRIKS